MAIPNKPPKEPQVFNPKFFYRAATIDRAAVNTEARSARLTFSSEAGVMRWFGREILLHDPDCVDMQRLQTMGACLINHDPDQIAGPVREATISDHRGHAVVGFDDDDTGNRAMAKAASGSLRGVSVSYLIHRAIPLKENEEYEHARLGRIVGPALIATRWEPIEISLTPIPADSHVGVGRDASRSLDGIQFEQAPASEKEALPMDDRIRKYLESRGLDPKATEEQAGEFAATLGEADRKRASQSAPVPPPAAPKEQPVNPTETLAAIRESAVALGQVDLAFQLASEGKSADAIRAAMLAEVIKARGAPAGPTAPQPEKSEALQGPVLVDALKNPQPF